MSGVTVKQFADKVGIQLDLLLSQLKNAGISVDGPDAEISDSDRKQLLQFLRKSHGKEDQAEQTPKKITLRRKSKSQLVQSSPNQRRSKSVNVEIHKKRTYVKRSLVPKDNERLMEAEAAKKALDQRAETERKLKEDQQKVEESQIEQQQPEITAEDQQIEAPVAQQEEAMQQPMSTSVAAVPTPSIEKSEKEAKAIPHSVKPAEQPKPEKRSQPADKTNSANKAEHKGRKKKERVAEPKTEEAAQADRKSRDGKPKVKGKHRPKQFFTDELDENDKRGKRRKKGKTKLKDLSAHQHQFERPTEPRTKEIQVPEAITVSELAQKMSIKVTEVIKKLMTMGTMATINHSLDQDTAMLVVEEFGHRAVIGQEKNPESQLFAQEDPSSGRSPRAPVVTIMGHVDHGKTSLLDYIRKSKVADGEAGGITQHIGAYYVQTDNGMITFLDTPGHAAFSAMRSRGSKITDIVVLVVAADDGVMPQTQEAIQHAKAGNVPLIIAVNKIDKPDADAEKVKQELSGYEVVPEEWGGETIFVNVSAKTGQGIDELLDAILLQAEMLELSAINEGLAKGTVIESSLDKGRGPVATILVQKGQLNKGDIVLCGQQYGRVRAMFDQAGTSIDVAVPSMPVAILGLSASPSAGDDLHTVSEERQAREIAELRRDNMRSQKLVGSKATKLEDIFTNLEEQKVNVLNVLIKADVQGSVEALRDALLNLSTDEVAVKIIASGVGGVNESDVNLTTASNGIIIAFNVRADASAKQLVDEKELDLRYYSVIYEAIDDVRNALSGLLEPEIREEIVGLAEVRDVFKSSKLGAIAGCMVVDGFIKRNLPIRVLRDNVVIYEGHLESLRRFKEDTAEVKLGMECGIGVKNYNDVKSGDAIEVFERSVIARSI